MSTRSRIGIEGEDGAITSVYCHFDGYPSGVGATLLDHWDTAERVAELVALGDLSSCTGPDVAPVGSREGGVVAYARWRGETGVEAQTSPDRAAYLALTAATGGEYTYLYGPRGWECAAGYGARAGAFAPLADVLAAEEDEDEA
ncbi:MAG TPA: hypothetical protein VFL91_21285 [Thermomicrobiales bacterium]|nr:hypothetical protein [Thermomicrobiales bacterium]